MTNAVTQKLLVETGLELAYSDAGSGRSIVFLHGGCMSRRLFARKLHALEGAHRVVAFDFRGHGESSAVEGGHTVPQYARDLRYAIELLGLMDIVIVGRSMGALVAWEYLSQFRHDPRVAGVVAISQGPSDLQQSDWSFGIADVDELHHYVEAMQSDFRAFFEGFVPSMFKTPLSHADFVTLLAETQMIGANAGSLIMLDQTLRDYRTLIPKFAVPHLLVWGRDEKLIPLGSGRWLNEHLSNSELVVFDDSGHCPMWEEATRFNHLIGSWIGHLPGLRAD